MKLKLTVNGKILSSVPVDEKLASNEYYLKAFRRLLLMRHRKELSGQNTVANFSLEIPLNSKAVNQYSLTSSLN